MLTLRILVILCLIQITCCFGVTIWEMAKVIYDNLWLKLKTYIKSQIRPR